MTVMFMRMKCLYCITTSQVQSQVEVDLCQQAQRE